MGLFIVAAVPNWAASALAASMLLSAVCGAVIPLSTFPLYESIGIAWTYTLIALLQTGLAVVPLCIYLLSNKLKGRWAVKI
jgi:hypothetical protein